MMREFVIAWVVCVGMVGVGRGAEGWKLTGKVVEGRIRPVGGARVIGKDVSRPERRFEATTAANGNFEWQIPKGTVYVVLVAEDAAGPLMGFSSVWHEQGGDPPPRIITLKPAHELTIKVVDGAGQPVEGAQVGIMQQSYPLFQGETGKEGTLRVKLGTEVYATSIVGLKAEMGYDYFTSVPRDGNIGRKVEEVSEPLTLKLDGARTLTLRGVNRQKDPVAGVVLSVGSVGRKGNPARNSDYYGPLFQQKTDAEGVATFDWLPVDLEEEISLSCLSEEYETGIEYRLRIRPNRGEYVVPLLRKVPFSGRLLKADGSPAVGVEILIRGQGAHRNINRELWTDLEGKFEVLLPGASIYSVFARAGDEILQQPDLIVREGEPMRDLEWKMVPGTVVRGRFLQKTKQRSFERQYAWMGMKAKPLPAEFRFQEASIESNLGERTFRVHTQISANGDYRFAVGPGTYVLGNPFDSSEKRIVTVTNQKEIVQDFQLDLNEIPIRGSVVDAEGNAVGWAKLKVIYPDRLRQSPFEIQANKAGVVEGTRKEESAEAYIFSLNHRLSLITKLDPKKEGPYRFELQKASQVRGRIVDGEGNPRKNARVYYRAKMFADTKDETTVSDLTGKVTTDAEGRYQISGLATGAEWGISLDLGDGSYAPIKEIFLVEPGEFDLGDFERK